MAERTTDLNVASHRRLVLRALVGALRSVFDSDYNRERQLIDLKITAQYPLERVDYPCIVVEYQPQRVINAGVGHEEWFTDANDILRKWHHRRFEGSINFNIFGLSTLDRDILSDALTEVISFGRLDSQLIKFFDSLYGSPNDPVTLQFTQLMLNADEIDFGGDSASIAPWSPEDLLVYETSATVQLHGGYYNVIPTDEWHYVSRAKAIPYPEGNQVGELEIPWTNPFEFEDDTSAEGGAVISGDDVLA